MKNNSKKEANWKQNIIHELRLYLAYTLCLTLFFSTFSSYRKLILKEYSIDYIRYGYNFFESLVLAKIILIGQRFKLGERFPNKPLIFPTLYKTVVFSFFVLIFSILEHFVVGFFHHKSVEEVAKEFIQMGVDEIIAQIMVMFFFFIFFFAFLEIDQVMGEQKLFKLFFKSNNSSKSQ